MKRISFTILSVFTAAAMLFCVAGCNKGKSTSLGVPAEAASFNWSEREGAPFKKVSASAAGFAARLAPAAYASANVGGNFAISPLSVYSALAMAATCSAGGTQSQILSALCVDYADLSAGYGGLYRSVLGEWRDDFNKLSAKCSLTNSVWLDSSADFKQPCIDSLSRDFFTFTYAADFARDNQNANRAVRYFVKQQTNKLIDRDFNLSPYTLFTLINTLYLKDVWNMNGRDLGYAEGEHTFTASNGAQKGVKLLNGYYFPGKVGHGEGYSYFYTRTYHNYSITFILPETGREVGQVFTPQTLALIEGAEYEYKDDIQLLRYNTRCLFPEFSASYNGSLNGVLGDMGIKSLFFDPDLTPITNSQVDGADVVHSAVLNVTKKGIEGAAATVIPAAGAAGPDEYTDVYQDFVVDRAFAFVLCDGYGTTLFSGVVNDV